MKDTVRVSVVFPRELWQRVQLTIPAGERSRAIAAATDHELRKRQRLASVARLQALQAEWRRLYGEMPSSAEDIRELREERDARLHDLP